MISTDEMSSTSMDISESFRPEDLSKTDFFDFVSASEMDIGVGISNVGVGLTLQAQHHQYQDQHHQQQPQSHDRLSTNSNMTHDGGGTAARNSNNISSNSMRSENTSDSTLPNYEFWQTSDKDSSRLDSSIFEDLDRYCWQQQQATTTSAQTHHTPANQTTSNTTHSDGTGSTSSALSCDSSATNSNATRTANSANITGGSSSISQVSNSTNNLGSTNVHHSDGQMYTITVLNGGNETTSATATSATPWLKREPEEAQIPTSLDLDSLLGNFSGYIKSEYPYDDSGFSTDGTKDAVNGDANGISIQQHQQETSTLHVMSNLGGGSGQALPSLVTAMSGGRACVNIGQQLAAQFQNNNNDWHMIDHNADHNSAESLLRSALQGKGYTKGVHHMQNGGIALLPASPSNKDDEMRRILFSSEADSLAFADSTLNTTQIFEESQHHTNLIQLHSNAPVTGTTPNGPMSQPTHSNNSSSLMVDDMFLTLENAFSDDFDKMKRIANEVHHYCNTPPVENDYMNSDIMMQISPTAASVGPPTTQLQPLHSPVTTTPSSMINIVPPPTSPLAAGTTTHHLHQQQKQLNKPEVTTSTTTSTTNAAMSTTNSRANTAKATKKYKRVSHSTTSTNNNNSLSGVNTNNSNINSSINNNNNTNTTTKNHSSSNNNSSTTINNNAAPSSGGSSSSSSNSPPTAHCNGQRKERSLHYCSICSKGFKDKYSVNVHIRTHTGEKPFACSLCGKSFRQKAHLAKHYQTHMAQKNNHGSGIIKGNSSKHHRTSSTAVSTNAAAAAAAAAQQRQLSMLTGSPIPSQITANTLPGSGSTSLGLGMNPNLLGITSAVVTLNGPTNSVSLATNVLTPPNSLMANR